MQEKNNIHTERREKIKEIIRNLLLTDEVSPEMSAILDRWYLENKGDSEVEQTLDELFEFELNAYRTPSAACLNTLEALKKRLGIATPEKKASRTRRMWLRTISVAAVFTGIVAVGASLLFLQKAETKDSTGQTVLFAEVTTEEKKVTVEAIEGIQKDIQLSDKTKVWVNSSTKISYPEAFGRERHVQLQGHARFEVERDTIRPFHVHTAHLNVRVLGTDFHVREEAEEAYTEVVLYSGSVEVNVGKQVEVLQPGEKLRYDHLTHDIKLEQVLPHTLEDWRSDRIFVDNKNATEIFHMIANYYDVEIVFDPTDFDEHQRYMFGFAKKEAIEDVLEAMAKISGDCFYYEIQEPGKTIYVRKNYESERGKEEKKIRK